MRYTRYEYKKYGKLKFLSSIVIIAVISITGGLYASKVIFKEKVVNGNEESVDNSNYNKGIIDENMNIIALQCGYYANKDNAENTLSSLNSYCSPFIVEENGKFRVIAGIYKEEDAIKKINELSSSNIEVAKIKMTMNGESDDDKKCFEIIDGFFTIIQKLEEEDVKSIKTGDFKKWASNISENDIGKKNKKTILILECVNNLPDEISKKDIADIENQIFKIINE